MSCPAVCGTVQMSTVQFPPRCYPRGPAGLPVQGSAAGVPPSPYINPQHPPPFLHRWGEQEVFWQVGGLAAEAVHYFDGDGGSIFVDRFPGLIRYLRVKGIPIHSVNTPRCNLVYFREVFHDAIELGHNHL